MADSIPSRDKEDKQDNDDNSNEEDLLTLKYILGEMGVQMLSAIYRGASTKNTIMMLSGVPPSCINGRLPVLIKLNLVRSINNIEFFITEKGKKLLNLLEK
ncbi:MAG: winged helix-turn-helix domain-containing protein [Promethearchaeota archaeon]